MAQLNGSAQSIDNIALWYPARPRGLLPNLQQHDSRLAVARDSKSASLNVDNCGDAGPGTLREAIANAANGATIDLTTLGCSEITLTTGEIHVVVNDLTLSGPGSSDLAIKGGFATGHNNRIFDHSHVGNLSISGVTLTDAHYIGDFANGGCVYSAGSLVLYNAVVTGCAVEAPQNSGAYALGGGIYARGDLLILGGAITGNFAISANNEASGGGVFGRGNLEAKYTTVANNTVVALQGAAVGGGIAVKGSGAVTIFASTISGNAAQVGGGLHVDTVGISKIENSTISGNYASYFVGGAAFLSLSEVTLSNSTVTANGAPSVGLGAGIHTAGTLTAHSTIFADNVNTAGDVALDVYSPLIAGNDNLIVAANSAVPTGTVIACPRLKPLADNGGPTLTHALISGSPAIDAGNNNGILDWDQRIDGFPRIYGASADIGAVEWQGAVDDSIFRSAFEVRCD